MNLYKTYLSEIKNIVIKNDYFAKIGQKNVFNGVNLQNPPEKFDYDFSSNIAMVISKILNENPKIISQKIKILLLKQQKDFKVVDIAGPGFLNFKLTQEAWLKIIKSTFKSKNIFGSNKGNKKFNVEFVSANPTGPMHVGHCRGAIFGDVLSNLLKFCGNKITKEFYVNDYGNQINDFTHSVYFRLRELKYSEPFPSQKNLYPGIYIIDIAKKILKENPKLKFDNFNKVKNKLTKDSLKLSMNLIKSDLKKLGIKHDLFFSETKLIKENLVDKTVNKLRKNKFIDYGYLEPPKGEENFNWKKEKKLIFKSTLFGDDLDRALQKSDGSWTYFANDVAYHSTKVSKKYDYLINVLGADHTGYIKRISAAVKALSKNKISLICKVCQLVKLFKDGKPYKMSKRSGEFISVNDILKEVDKDSIRFMMLNRGNDVELDFDFNKVLQKNKDNPVFYVQYCYARINSLFKSAKFNLKKEITINTKDFKPNDFEIKLLRKIMEWPRIVDISVQKYEPHRIPFYLYELATIFHSYWSKGNEDLKFKFIINGKVNNLLSFMIFQLLSVVVENGMNILGVSLPKKM